MRFLASGVNGGMSPSRGSVMSRCACSALVVLALPDRIVVVDVVSLGTRGYWSCVSSGAAASIGKEFFPPDRRDVRRRERRWSVSLRSDTGWYVAASKPSGLWRRHPPPGCGTRATERLRSRVRPVPRSLDGSSAPPSRLIAGSETGRTIPPTPVQRQLNTCPPAPPPHQTHLTYPAHQTYDRLLPCCAIDVSLRTGVNSDVANHSDPFRRSC
jgi:hypothetical protein